MPTIKKNLIKRASLGHWTQQNNNLKNPFQLLRKQPHQRIKGSAHKPILIRS